MKRVILGSLATLAMSISLNAAVYATVDGQDVNDQDIAALMKAMPDAKFETLSDEQRKSVINQAVERKLLSKKALEDGIENDAEYKSLMENIKSNLALEIWMKRVFEKIKVADKDVKAYFDTNSAKFVKPETVKARHILLKDEQAAKDVIAELKGLKGDALLNKFTELAKTKSTGPSGKNGGDLGWFNARQMVQPFSVAAFALEKGAVTQTPVKTQFGYHVILSEDKKGGEKVTFDEAKVQIENGLKMSKFRDDVSAQAKELKKTAKITYK
jgi:parvulin-like peptidyl-prolyl isomerase